MAQLGFRKIDEMIGRVDKLRVQKAIDHWKAKGLDLTPLLAMPDVGTDVPRTVWKNRIMGLTAYSR